MATSRSPAAVNCRQDKAGHIRACSGTGRERGESAMSRGNSQDPDPDSSPELGLIIRLRLRPGLAWLGSWISHVVGVITFGRSGWIGSDRMGSMASGSHDMSIWGAERPQAPCFLPLRPEEMCALPNCCNKFGAALIKCGQDGAHEAHGCHWICKCQGPQ